LIKDKGEIQWYGILGRFFARGLKINSQRRGYSIKLSWFRKQGNAYSQNIKISGMLK